jgi:hypothetical protein
MDGIEAISPGDEGQLVVRHHLRGLAFSAVMNPTSAAPQPIPLANRPTASTVLTCMEERRERPTLAKKMKRPTKKIGRKRAMRPRVSHSA